jgi:hypothetical protein
MFYIYGKHFYCVRDCPGSLKASLKKNKFSILNLEFGIFPPRLSSTILSKLNTSLSQFNILFPTRIARENFHQCKKRYFPYDSRLYFVLYKYKKTGKLQKDIQTSPMRK